MSAPFNYLFLGLFLLSSLTLRAQSSLLKADVNTIDSLIYYSHFKEAETRIDSILTELDKLTLKREDQTLKLKLLLQLAFLEGRQLKTNRSLEISLNVIDEAKKHNLPEMEYQAMLIAATVYEHSTELNLSKQYLDQAYRLYARHDLKHLFSIYCIRMSSYYRLKKDATQAIAYAKKGIEYANRYQNRREYIDGCLLLGILLSDENFQESVRYSKLAAEAFKGKNDYEAAIMIYNNIANTYISQDNLQEALRYNNLMLEILIKHRMPVTSLFYDVRYRIYEALGNRDSAFYYFKAYHQARVTQLEQKESLEIKKITEIYQNDKKEELIRTKNKEIRFIVGLLVVSLVAAAFIILQYRKINNQNKIINKQVVDLRKALDQKQVLFSELQHRVKNNLQQIISLLEIQKESIDYHNIEAVIQSNQNRIHSMALLHQMLDVAEKSNEVVLKEYVSELCKLVKDSHHIGTQVELTISGSDRTLSVDQALPIGFIVVELLSNSLKHAFINRENGLIKIEFNEEVNGGYCFHYSDNGVGFNLESSSKKGLGLEIIRGLVEQLFAKATWEDEAGFGIKIRFK